MRSLTIQMVCAVIVPKSPILALSIMIVASLPTKAEQSAIGMFLAGDYGTGVAGLRDPARGGDAASQFYLGVAYAQGWGVISNAKTVVEWYRRGAEQGYVKAQLNVALAYLGGAGTAVDTELAGLPRGQNALGMASLMGEGTGLDMVEATAWFRLAGEGDLAIARINERLARNQMDAEMVRLVEPTRQQLLSAIDATL